MGKGSVEMEISPETNKEEKMKELLERGVVDIIGKKKITEAIKSGKQLRVKFGIDVTDPELHFGHAVGLFKLRQFQDLGQKVILLAGDFTGMIGDPTGRMTTREPLTREQILANMATFKEQAGKILDFDSTTNPVELRYNSEWLPSWSAKDFFLLAKRITANQILSRKTFTERLKQGGDMTIPEFLYPVLQGYDSFALEADVELGGTEQIFNLMMGRKIQKLLGQKSQAVMTLKLLPGLDGKKMSKSARNTINLTDSPEVMKKKLMSLEDELIVTYSILATAIPYWEIETIQELVSGSKTKEAKQRLVEKTLALYHPKTK